MVNMDIVWYCSTVTHKRDKIIYHWCEEVVGLFIELITDHLINYVAQLLLPGWRQPLENWRLPKAPARPEEEQSGHNHCGCQSSRERAVYLRQIEVRPSLLGISDSQGQTFGNYLRIYRHINIETEISRKIIDCPLGCFRFSLCSEYKNMTQQYAPLQDAYKPDPKAFFPTRNLEDPTT